MPASDFTLITNASHPAYSEEVDSYLDPGNAKARRLFIKGSPSPRKGIAAFYCLTKAGFSGIEGDSISLRLSFQNHQDGANSTNPGDIGLFAFADKARLQAMADANSTAGYSDSDVMEDDMQGVSMQRVNFKDNRHSEFRLGRNEQHGNGLPSNIDQGDDFAVKNASDWQHIRMDITIYTDSGLKKVKVKGYQSKKNIPYPTTEAAWEDASNFAQSEKTDTWQKMFDYDGNGVVDGGVNWASGDPIEGSLTNSAGDATEAVSGFYWRDAERGHSNRDEQAYQPQVTIGRFECRIKSDTV
ncbi:MAG: hypothetical protein CMJ20_06740 [Phycisphaeraceae bacterium]|nr:hypothetical protein [Phycisphaeraceae bacterium]